MKHVIAIRLKVYATYLGQYLTNVLLAGHSYRNIGVDKFLQITSPDVKKHYDKNKAVQ